MTIAIADPRRTGYAAEVVANAFLDLAAAEGRTLTQMQVHKLVYIAHGWTLALLGRPLIYNTVHAWRHGPVVRKLWDHWRGQRELIAGLGLPVASGEPELRDDPEALEVILSVWRNYGQMDGEELSRLTHLPGSPWTQTFGLPNDLIPNEVTREYYIRLARGA